MIRIEKRNLGKTLFAIPLCAVLSAYDFISEPLDLNVLDIFISKVLGRVTSYNNSSYILTVQNLSFVIIFNFAFSGYIANHFRYSCVYVFSRLRSRRHWYYSRVIEIMIYDLIYLILFFGCNLFVCIQKSTMEFEPASLGTIAALFGFSFLLVINTTLAINLLSMKWGTTVSFFSIQTVLFLLIALAFFFYDISWAVILNPVSCLDFLNKDVNSVLFIVLNNLVCFVSLLCLGKRRIVEYDVALFDAEVS